MHKDPSNQRVLREIPYAKTVFLLGTAGDGPVNMPVEAKYPDRVKQIFGTKGTLYKGFMQGYSVDPGLNYYLVRIAGKYARCEYFINEVGEVIKGLSLKSRGAGIKYNSVKVEIGKAQGEQALIISLPDTRLIAYSFNDYPTLGELARVINTDAEMGGIIYAHTNNPYLPANSLLALNPPEQYLEGGEDGLELSKNDIYIALEKTYQILEGTGIRIIVPLEVYFDDIYNPYYYNIAIYGQSYYTLEGDLLELYDTVNDKPCTFHEQLIDFCRAQQRHGLVTHGVLGIRPFSEDLLVSLPELGYDYVVRLAEVTALKDREGFAETSGTTITDKGFYISIFAGDFNFELGNEYYWDNGAVVYAATIARHSPETTSNKRVSGNMQYQPLLNSSELKSLSKLGVVACRNSPKNGLVVHNGVTPALHTSELHDLANVTMVQHVVWQLNLIFQEYVGQNIPFKRIPVVIKDLTNRAKDLLRNLKDQGVILDYNIEIVPTIANWWACNLKLAGKYTVQDIEVPLGIQLG